VQGSDRSQDIGIHPGSAAAATCCRPQPGTAAADQCSLWQVPAIEAAVALFGLDDERQKRLGVNLRRWDPEKHGPAARRAR
jgi:hypothetical protein